jgi:uncharacterized membrane protein YgdD (TMEM256/DUF423 family)
MLLGKITAISAILGGFAVILGAFGAHALKETLTVNHSTSYWDKAVFYQLSHAIALVAVSQKLNNYGERWLRCIAGVWLFGILLFSGSLYILAAGGPRWLGPVTPVGGLLLIIGWVFLAIVSLRRPPER